MSRTKAENERFDKLKELGCIACILNGEEKKIEAEIHHYLSGGRRIGDHATVPLCYWHHQGLPWWGCTKTECEQAYGPSFHKHTRSFRKRYGSDEELLKIVNGMIKTCDH